MGKASTTDLPLRSETPSEWASQALREPLALLNDHAWLEKKAASNALELLNRWPEPCPPENWVQAMTAIARDEVEHLAVVTRLLARRGGRLTKQHRCPYAADLRALVRLGHGLYELMDRAQRRWDADRRGALDRETFGDAGRSPRPGNRA